MMTVLNTEYRKQITDSGTTIDITNFGIRATNEVVIIKFDGTSESTLSITVDYTINSSLSTVTLNSALTSGESATATLNIADTQSEEYTINSSNNAGKLEDALDKLTLNIKKKQERVDRAVAKQLSDLNPGISFASFNDKANFFANVNAAETQIDFEHVGGATFWSDYTFPVGDGTANQVLKTDGSLTLDWDDIENVAQNFVVGELVYDLLGSLGGSNQIIRSKNISSVTANITGDDFIDVTFTTAVPNSNYIIVGSLEPLDGGGRGQITFKSSDSKTTTGFRVSAGVESGGNWLLDRYRIHLLILN